MKIKSSILPVLATIVFTGCQSWQVRQLEQLDATAALPETSEPGKVQIRYWDNIEGATVDALTGLEGYPNTPTAISELQKLQSLENRAENYGAMVQGYIVPPSTGEYQFFVSGDDETQLWLSSDDSPTNAQLIASVPGWSYPENYNKFSSQRSGLKFLDQGNKYYFQVIFKEGVGDDHFTIAWEGPGFALKVIGSESLYSWAQPTQGGDNTDPSSYSLGYRVGFLDGSEGLSFTQTYPPLDSDQDGLYDNWEVIMGLDPSNSSDANSDPDNDLLTAAEEFRIGTREGNADTDGDGMPDGAEFAYALDPLDASDATLDMDGDGYTNIEEYIAGTNMDSPSDFPTASTETTTPSAVAGFSGQYFSGTEFNSYIVTIQGEALQFDWSTNPPIPELPKDRFSVRWYGNFTPPHSSGVRSYRFALTSDDGIRMSFGNETAINSWIDRGASSDVIERSFEAGTAVPILIEYYEKTGSAVATLAISDLATGQTFDNLSVIASPDLESGSATDSDDDGLPDIWELAYGTNPLFSDATETFNNQGISALEAYQSSLHPWTLEPTSDSSPSGSTDETVTPGQTGTVSLSWTAPSTRTDGTSISLSEIAYYILSYGQSETSLDQSLQIESDQTSYTFTDLSTGTWYFSIKVVDTDGLMSEGSIPVSFSVN